MNESLFVRNAEVLNQEENEPRTSSVRNLESPKNKRLAVGRGQKKRAKQHEQERYHCHHPNILPTVSLEAID
jgi:hypothetical protein